MKLNKYEILGIVFWTIVIVWLSFQNDLDGVLILGIYLISILGIIGLIFSIIMKRN